MKPTRSICRVTMLVGILLLASYQPVLAKKFFSPDNSEYYFERICRDGVALYHMNLDSLLEGNKYELWLMNLTLKVYTDPPADFDTMPSLIEINLQLQDHLDDRLIINREEPYNLRFSDSEGYKAWAYGVFTWDGLVDVGTPIVFRDIKDSQRDSLPIIEDCFIDERNDPNWNVEPTALELAIDATRIQNGQCTKLRWQVENVQAVWVYPQGGKYTDYGVEGQGNREVCPTATTTYEMRVLLKDNEVELRQVRVEVQAVAAQVPTTTTPVTAVPTTTQTTARVNNASLNVHTGPAANHVIVAKLRRGETFYVRARTEGGDWVLLAIPNAPGGLGWVPAPMVTLSAPIQTLPSYETTATATVSANNATLVVTPTADAGVATPITNFETWGRWTRGDERWGTFSQDNQQIHGGRFSGRFDYDFPANVPNNYIVYRSVMPISGQPQALEVWVYGDGSQHFLNAWLQDAKGQLWQFTFGPINHTGWQRMVAPLDLSRGWPNQAIGGSSGTQMTYPLKFYAFVLDGYTEEKAFVGTVYVDDLASLNRVPESAAP